MAAFFCSSDISFSLEIPAEPAKTIPSMQTATPKRMTRPEPVPRTSEMNRPRKIGGINVPKAAV